jgi:hypothetical protein
MRKLIILAASLVALAVVIATPLALDSSANAAVTYDDTFVGQVDKGDVQLLFGWNDEMLQEKAASLQFTAKQTHVLEMSWTCSNGATHHYVSSGWKVSSLNVRTDTNKHGKITAFNLNGTSGIGTLLPGTTTGPSPFSCPTGGTPDYSTITYDVTNTPVGVYVNGVELPETPVVTEPVA